jgi:hypothetical protein
VVERTDGRTKLQTTMLHASPASRYILGMTPGGVRLGKPGGQDTHGENEGVGEGSSLITKPLEHLRLCFDAWHLNTYLPAYR